MNFLTNSLKNNLIMSKKIITSIILLAAIIIANNASAQNESLTTLSYSMGLGAGNTHDFISKYSWRGFAFDYRKMTTDNVGVGINLGWNTFYEAEPYGTYTFETVSASGYQYRYLNSFPMTANVDYFAKPHERVNPYLGIGLGVQYMIQTVDFGIYRFESDGWPFTVNPEVGLLLQPRNSPTFNLGIKFMYAVKSNDLEPQSQFLFNVGMAFGE